MSDAFERVAARAQRLVVALGLVLFAFGIVRTAILEPPSAAERYGQDFDVAYCGVRVAFARADPYLVEPLRGCERTLEPARRPVWSVTPMPLAGYALALLAPLGFMPYPAAKALWILVLFASFVLAAWALSRVVQRSFWFVALLCAPSIGALNLLYGEPVPLAIAALCAGAWAFQRQRPRLGAALVCVAMIEPHVGLAALAAVALLVPRARLVLAIGVALLACASVAMLGISEDLEYVATFLPAQALAELPANDQYSLAHVLALAGAPAALAMRAGSLQYALCVALGVYAAARILRSGGSPAAAVLVPVVPAMLGGLFVHDVEIAAALPGALLLATSDATAGKLAGFGALLLVFSADAAALINRPLELALLVAVAAAALGLFPHTAFRARAVGAIVAPLLWLAILHVAEREPLAHSTYVPHPELVAAAALAPELWAMRIRAPDGWSIENDATFLLKLPLWAGLGAATLAALRARPRLTSRLDQT